MCVSPGHFLLQTFQQHLEPLALNSPLPLEAPVPALLPQHTTYSLDLLKRRLLAPESFKANSGLRVFASTFSQPESSSLDHLTLDLSSLSSPYCNQALEQVCPAWDFIPAASTLSFESLTGSQSSSQHILVSPPWQLAPHWFNFISCFLLVPFPQIGRQAPCQSHYPEVSISLEVISAS